jgi:hypothetical protein
MAESRPDGSRPAELPVVVALGSVDPALVAAVRDVLSGREPQAVADPAWRARRLARQKEVNA